MKHVIEAGNAIMQRTTTTILILAAALAVCAPAADAQQVYRWVDENGVVHFGDRAPEGVQATPLRVRPNTVTSVAATGVKPPPVEGAEAADADPAAVDPNAPPAPELSVAEQRRPDRVKSVRRRCWPRSHHTVSLL